MLEEFAAWLSKTSLSVLIQNHNGWVIPTIQSVHIVAIGIVLTSVLMIDLRVLGLAAGDQTLRQTTSRFFPWLSGSLVVLLATGVLMVVGEPVRELLSLSFWLKMLLVATGTFIASIFKIALRNEASILDRRGVKVLAILTLAVWVGVVILGRLIAYDYVWGSWSLKPKV